MTLTHTLPAPPLRARRPAMPARRAAPARRTALSATPPRAIPVELTLKAEQQLATRIAQLLRHDLAHTIAKQAPEPGWMTAKQLAAHLHLTPAWVYQHADMLGAIRTGHGPKARMRFNLATATEALERISQKSTPPPTPAMKRRLPVAAGPYRGDVPLLEIRGRRGHAGRGFIPLIRRPKRRVW